MRKGAACLFLPLAGAAEQPDEFVTDERSPEAMNPCRGRGQHDQTSDPEAGI